MSSGATIWSGCAIPMRSKAAVVGVALLLTACGAAQPRFAPVRAPAPSPALLTAELTLSRTGPQGAAQQVDVRPNGEWTYTPPPGSAYAGQLNAGRLPVAAHIHLAQLLESASFHSESAQTPQDCPGGYRYRLAIPGVEADWTDCDARPTLSAITKLVLPI
jgi:hypothetical protein